MKPEKHTSRNNVIKANMSFNNSGNNYFIVLQNLQVYQYIKELLFQLQ